jgi:hypothetical protein
MHHATKTAWQDGKVQRWYRARRCELSEPVRAGSGGVSLPRLLDLAHAVGREQLADRAGQHLAGGDPLGLLGLEL